MKHSKKSVRYTDDHGSSSEQCSKCSYYVNRTTCKIVEGKINPAGWCNKFKRMAAVDRMERTIGDKYV